MDAVHTLESEVRELIRRSGLDPARDEVEVRRLVSDAVADYDERSLHGGMPLLADLDAASKAVWDTVAGYGPLQQYFDDPRVEEIWVNEPTPRLRRPARRRRADDDAALATTRCETSSSGC